MNVFSLFIVALVCTAVNAFSVKIAASEVLKLSNDTTIFLNEKSYCNITYVKPPYEAMCFAGISIKRNDRILVEIGAYAGAKADITKDGRFDLVLLKFSSPSNI